MQVNYKKLSHACQENVDHELIHDTKAAMPGICKLQSPKYPVIIRKLVATATMACVYQFAIKDANKNYYSL